MYAGVVSALARHAPAPDSYLVLAFMYLCRSAQLELEAVQIRVKAANSAISESKQYLNKLPEYLKDVEKALVPLRK